MPGIDVARAQLILIPEPAADQNTTVFELELHEARAVNSPKAVSGLDRKLYSEVRTLLMSESLQVPGALRKMLTTAGVVTGVHGAAPEPSAVYPLGHRKFDGIDKWFRSARIMVRLLFPGRVLALMIAQVPPMAVGWTVVKTVTPEHVTPMSSHFTRQSWTLLKVARPCAGSWIPTDSAPGSCKGAEHTVFNLIVLCGFTFIASLSTYMESRQQITVLVANQQGRAP
jgi:hypothetical protein